jgi:MFS family permease
LRPSAASPEDTCAPAAEAVPQARHRRDFLASHADGVAYGAMVGLGETYLPAFALAVGLGEITAGLVASVPLLAGGLMQTVSPIAVRRLRSHKTWVLVCALGQAISFLPLVWAAVAGRISAPGILLVAAVYWGAGLATGPAWNTWIGTLVPPDRRARFFATRTRLSQAAVLAGVVAAGIVLECSGDHQRTLLAFAAIFAAAGLSRLLSFGMLAAQSEPVPTPANMRRMGLAGLWRYVRTSDGGQLICYLVAVQGAVQFAGPYFVPYLLAKLEFSYAQYVVLIATAFLAKIVALNAWGRFASRFGAMRLLWLGGIGITPVAALWLISGDFVFLLFLQLIAGVVWGAYELAFFLLFFESIPEEDRTSVLTAYNLANTAAWVAGSTLGGLLLYSLHAHPSAYLWLFALSSAGRALALVLLWRQPALSVEVASIGVRTVAVRPMSATVDVPILPSLPDQVSATEASLPVAE